MGVVLFLFVLKSNFLSCSCRSTDTHTQPAPPPLEFLRHPSHLHSMVCYLIALEYHYIKRLMQPVTSWWKSTDFVIGRLKSGRPFVCSGWKHFIVGSVTFAPASRWWPCRWNQRRPVNSRHNWSWHPGLVPRDPVTCWLLPWCCVQRRRNRHRRPHCQSLC